MNTLKNRRNNEKDQRRQSILDAAKDLFAMQGVDSTTIEQIASSCQLSRSLIYTYFLDKNHIFLVVVYEALEAMLEDFERAIVTEKSGLDRISAIGWAYVSFANSRPEYYEATLSFQFSKKLFPNPSGKGKDALVERFESDFKLVANRANQINQLMASQIEMGIQDGSIRKDIKNPLQTALSLWSMTGGLIQTSAANEQMFCAAYGISQHDIIAQGLAIAREGLKNTAGHQ
jgi:AcrR family transcriptional regulator